MTSNNAPGQRPRMMAAVVLAAAAATVAGLVVAVAPANAAPDAYIALSIELLNDNPPVSTVGGSSIGPSESQAGTASLTNCVNNGGSHCVTQVVAKNACAAAASNLLTALFWAT